MIYSSRNKHVKTKNMRTNIFYVIFLVLMISACGERGYGKHGRCQATTKSGSQCKSNAGKTGYCGTHK